MLVSKMKGSSPFQRFDKMHFILFPALVYSEFLISSTSKKKTITPIENILSNIDL
jgi:hypothetical protein